MEIQLMKRSFLESIITSSKQTYDNGPKRMNFQSSGIYLKPDNKVKQVENKSTSVVNKTNINEANIIFEQWKKSTLKTINSNQLNSTLVSKQTPDSSPIKREPILSPIQARNKQAAQLFTNITDSQPQTSMFANLMTPAAKISARNSQSASTTSSSSAKTSTSPIQLKNQYQQNIPNTNPFVKACRFQVGQNGGSTQHIIGSNVLRQENSVSSVGKFGPNLATQAALSNPSNNSLGLSQNANNISFPPWNNIQLNEATRPISINQTFRNPQQDIFYNQSTNQDIIIDQNSNISLNNQVSVSNQQQNLFQPSPQHQHSSQSYLKTNKPPSSSQRPTAKHAKIPTNAGINNSSNNISLDAYFPSMSAQAPIPSPNLNLITKPHTPSPPPTAPSLFDPNYHFQYVSDPIFEGQMEIEMDELTVEDFIAKSTAQMAQIGKQLEQMCNKCLGRLKEQCEVEQISSIFDQLDRYILKDSLVSKELDLLEAQQYEMEKSLTVLQKMFPENCMHPLSYELEDYHQLQDQVKRLGEKEEDSPQFQSVLLLYSSLNAIEERVRKMDGKLDLLYGRQHQ